ncbi:MAG: histidinol phosphate phosphatase domain-containing protein [Candidatus Omnitrophota bacterium]
MYNLHAHSLLSDGVLLPSEVAVRYLSAGYKAIAITDHVDYSNITAVIKQILEFCRHWPESSGIKILPGIELTHLPPQQYKTLAKYAREKGIKVIVAHGESPVEPLLKGTNSAALEADIDILAHPGHISKEDVLRAKKRGVFLEITARVGHCSANRHVAMLALKTGAKLILNTDSHTPQDIIPPDKLITVARRAGLSAEEIRRIQEEIKKFFIGEK